MEQGAGDAGGDGEQVVLVGEHFHLAGTGEFREIDGTATADAGGGGFVGSNRRKEREQLAGVDEKRLDGSSFSCARVVEHVHGVAYR